MGTVMPRCWPGGCLVLRPHAVEGCGQQSPRAAPRVAEPALTPDGTVEVQASLQSPCSLEHFAGKRQGSPGPLRMRLAYAVLQKEAVLPVQGSCEHMAPIYSSREEAAGVNLVVLASCAVLFVLCPSPRPHSGPSECSVLSTRSCQAPAHRLGPRTSLPLQCGHTGCLSLLSGSWRCPLSALQAQGQPSRQLF
ncbi:unnamed protein product [Pipistrellus nathusii]|uniref:Uncharacterized protein n=1 Tax=Pipistrellus nathusii TaxID=59473 RepID=A0ABP0A7M3_PIPNA